MKKSIANMWVKALRSGKYTQTKNALCDNVGHCCLGVLCELYIKDTKNNIKRTSPDVYDEEGMVSFDGKTELLPSCVIKWAGMIFDGEDKSSGTFRIGNKSISLAAWNDGKCSPFKKSDNTVVKGTFKNIANVIEEFYKNI